MYSLHELQSLPSLVTGRFKSFFLFSPAGNVLLTEDGTVKLGKAWDVTLYIIFPCTAST